MEKSTVCDGLWAISGLCAGLALVFGLRRRSRASRRGVILSLTFFLLAILSLLGAFLILSLSAPAAWTRWSAWLVAFCLPAVFGVLVGSFPKVGGSLSLIVLITLGIWVWLDGAEFRPYQPTEFVCQVRLLAQSPQQSQWEVRQRTTWQQIETQLVTTQPGRWPQTTVQWLRFPPMMPFVEPLYYRLSAPRPTLWQTLGWIQTESVAPPSTIMRLALYQLQIQPQASFWNLILPEIEPE